MAGHRDNPNIQDTILGWIDILNEFEDEFFSKKSDIETIKNKIESLRDLIGVENHAKFLRLFKEEKLNNPSQATLQSFKAVARTYALKEPAGQVAECLSHIRPRRRKFNNDQQSRG